MKKLMLIAALLIPVAALAEEAYMTPAGSGKVGETLRPQFPTLLYVNRKCDLPLVNAKDMRRYESNLGQLDVGCWGQTIDGNALIVVPHRPPSSFALNTLMRVDVKADGTVTVKALPTYGR